MIRASNGTGRHQKRRPARHKGITQYQSTFERALGQGKEGGQTIGVTRKKLLKTPDKQLSLTDSDSRIMATSGRSSVMVGYNVQSAVDTKNHLIMAHEITNIGNDRAQLSKMAKKAMAILGVEKLDVLADRGYYSGLEKLACDEADIKTYLPKTLTSGNKAAGLYISLKTHVRVDRQITSTFFRTFPSGGLIGAS